MQPHPDEVSVTVQELKSLNFLAKKPHRHHFTAKKNLSQITQYLKPVLPFDSFVFDTTLQYVMNAKLSKHRFWHCHENGLIKTIQTIPHNL